jgi:LysM repeat protein
MRRSRAIRWACRLVAIVAAWQTERVASAYSHIVAPKETLAAIAERVYGDPKLETVLVGANALDSQGGSSIVPGMRIEIPAPAHHRIAAGETWGALATRYLGDERRADVLARANRAVAWIPPTPGQEIEVPYVLAHLASDGESTSTLAKRYLGDMNRAWELNAYNFRGDTPLRRGDVVLIPLPYLSLTPIGKEEAQRAAGEERSQGAGHTLDVQRKVEAELPSLLADVRNGRYVDAVARGNRLLALAELTKPQFATVHRALLEAYVALDATGAAAGACNAWRKLATDPKLDPRTTSPKILAVCRETGR